eukprot:TRINITY_DN9699_c0_g1_i1.p1 TRINITY_DN9699_c0_g1~~TRINITY_DN9699_c0_g1_i1.p1  ORF type:complete len:631 (-),score=129.84 TRINITY_DN9699_c0_g1_i1:187-2079(-)
MEFMDSSLETLLEEQVNVDRSSEAYMALVRPIARHVLLALYYLRKNDIIHGDVKPSNVLLRRDGNNWIAKLADFGNSVRMVDVNSYYDDFQIQSLFYRAPEVFLGNPFGPEIDMWSFGCVMCQMFTLKPIFLEKTVPNTLIRITSILGPIPKSLLMNTVFSRAHFNEDGDFIHVDNFLESSNLGESIDLDCSQKLRTECIEIMNGNIRRPIYSTILGLSLSRVVHGSSEKVLHAHLPFCKMPSKPRLPKLLNFLLGMFCYDPKSRLNPYQALFHDFLADSQFPLLLPFEDYPSDAAQKKNNGSTHKVVPHVYMERVENAQREARDVQRTLFENRMWIPPGTAFPSIAPGSVFPTVVGSKRKRSCEEECEVETEKKRKLGLFHQGGRERTTSTASGSEAERERKLEDSICKLVRDNSDLDAYIDAIKEKMRRKLQSLEEEKHNQGIEEKREALLGSFKNVLEDTLSQLDREEIEEDTENSTWTETIEESDYKKRLQHPKRQEKKFIKCQKYMQERKLTDNHKKQESQTQVSEEKKEFPLGSEKWVKSEYFDRHVRQNSEESEKKGEGVREDCEVVFLSSDEERSGIIDDDDEEEVCLSWLKKDKENHTSKSKANTNQDSLGKERKGDKKFK